MGAANSWRTRSELWGWATKAPLREFWSSFSNVHGVHCSLVFRPSVSRQGQDRYVFIFGGAIIANRPANWRPSSCACANLAGPDSVLQIRDSGGTAAVSGRNETIIRLAAGGRGGGAGISLAPIRSEVQTLQEHATHSPASIGGSFYTRDWKCWLQSWNRTHTYSTLSPHRFDSNAPRNAGIYAVPFTKPREKAVLQRRSAERDTPHISTAHYHFINSTVSNSLSFELKLLSTSSSCAQIPSLLRKRVGKLRHISMLKQLFI